MTVTHETRPEPATSRTFAGRMLDIYNAGALALGISLGHRLRLFDDLARLGLRNVELEVADAAELDPALRCDLAMAFDAIHDQARPARVLRGIRRALEDDGVFLMQEIATSTSLAENLDHPLGPFLYTLSFGHCMTVSLARDGAGLGTCWGRERAAEMLAEAGFTSIERHTLPHDPQNDFFVVRP